MAGGISHPEEIMPELQEVLPKYLQVANYYRDLIASGVLAAGDEIPSERQLAIEWGISRPTATRALGALRTQGLVESRQGSGTYVRERVQLHRRARDRYLRSRESGRIYAPGERAEIVAAESATLPDWVAELFDVPAGEQGIRRHRVTFSDESPAEVSTSWFPVALAESAPRLLRPDRIRAGTLAYVEQTSGRAAAYARDQLSARLATSAERTELELPGRAAAVLVVHHVVFDVNDRALECVEAVYPPDRRTFEQQYSVQP
jgi:DNA-binding GntR family transcriptional regulator